LSHVGFTGAAGAVLLGLTPLFGLLSFTLGGGVLIALLGTRASERDVQIGTVLAFMLGLGVLFISLYSGYATEAYSLLFGEILGISASDVVVTTIATVIILAIIVIIYRPLLFMSLDPDVAEAKGVPVYALNIIFLMLVGAATAISVQVVGVLLIFGLMVTPAAVAQRLARHPFHGVLISVLIAVAATWFGLFVSFYVPYPVSFFITTTTFIVFIVSRFLRA
jgi:zinc/manganese transport system permease protein